MTLITTLIPAYKKEYLGDVFAGLARQTLRDFRVVLSDDSPDGEITRMIRGGHFAAPLSTLNLTVVRGPRNARRNHEQLLDLWNGDTPLVHFHLDDDLIHPEFYRSHAAAHAQAGCGVSVSRRWLSGADGRPTRELPLPKAVAGHNERMSLVAPQLLFDTTVAVCENWLGELSNMVFSAEGACLYPRPPAQGLSYYGLLDIGTVLEIACSLPVAFIREHLGVFRQHPQQTTHNRHTHGARIAFLCWVAYALAAWQQRRIDGPRAAGAVAIASQRVQQHFPGDAVMLEYLAMWKQHAVDVPALHGAFSAFWSRLLAGDAATRAQQPAPHTLVAEPA